MISYAYFLEIFLKLKNQIFLMVYKNKDIWKVIFIEGFKKKQKKQKNKNAC